MEIQSLFSALETILHEHTGMGYFVDLLLKSTFVLALMLIGRLCAWRLAASVRHLVLCIGFMSLFILPLFIGLLPKIQVPIDANGVIIADSTMTRSIALLADNEQLVIGAWWEAFLGIYFTLLAIQLSYLFLGLCKVCALSRSALPVTNESLRQELDNLVFEEGLTVNVSLLKSRNVFAPVSWGLFTPQIILPEHAEHWDAEKIRNVLIHELSHIRRLDWLTTLVVRFTRALYWYNPLIWYAARKIEEDAEQSCDDAVILNGRCHSEYASNLLEIASYARLGSLGNALVQAIGGSFLGSRVFSILDTKRRRQNTEVVWVVRGLLIGCTVIALLASLRLVPLVNVTTIDPLASTAFSVIFIPKTQARTYDGYLDNLYDHQQRRNLTGDVTAVDQGATEVTGQVQGAANQDAGTASVVAQASRKPSLLEEYLNAAGSDGGQGSYERYVREYTNGVIQAVEERLDPECLVEKALTENQPDADATALVAIRTSQPHYPHIARQRGIEGYSIVEYDIDITGSVRDPVIVESSPGAVFNRSSLKAIERYQFEPPTMNGEVISLKGLQTKFVYQLKPG